MLRDLKENGLASIVEVVITAVVFIIAAAGIISTVTLFKPVGRGSSRKIEAAYIGKGVIDELRQQISAEDWADPNSNLAVGTYNTAISGYDITYTISEPITGLRHLTMNINFPDLD